MKVTAADWERMRRLAAALDSVETDEEPSPEVRAARIAEADRWRGDHGIPALQEEGEPSELELYRRARALGLRRSGG